jgi:hypothetical protein
MISGVASRCDKFATLHSGREIGVAIGVTGGRLIVESINEALKLFMRQAQLERAMKQPGGARVIEEQELLAVRRKLEALPKEARPVVEVK